MCAELVTDHATKAPVSDFADRVIIALRHSAFQIGPPQKRAQDPPPRAVFVRKCGSVV
mgnify:CR=1 FL=1